MTEISISAGTFKIERVGAKLSVLDGATNKTFPSDGHWIELFRFDRKTTKGATCDNNTVQLSRSIGNDFLFFVLPEGGPSV
jgi:hypothetical protein